MVATSLWTVTSAHYVRLHAAPVPASEALYQVELPHPGAALLGRSSGASAGPYSTRTRVTMGEAEVLSGSGIPSRQTATFRSRLLVGAPGEPPRSGFVRFVGTDFF